MLPFSKISRFLLRRGTPGAVGALLFLAASTLSAEPPRPDPLAPPGTGGVAALDRALARLSSHQRLLMVGAHPDDEDSSLLALAVRGLGGEAAYLSLSRGEGGQNLIGPELGVGLGLLRSRELLAARGIDGARQFFSRAYDFGYTRSLEEALSRWPRELLLEDAVRVMRRFRPQVMVSVFPGYPIQTHGQHQAAGVVAHEAYRVAGGPERLPQLAEEGLPPWQPLALYRATWFDPDSTTLEQEAGRLDPVSGRSIFQLAMASRSSHRSQDMGVQQPLGRRPSRLRWEEGAGGIEADSLFTGVDTRLAALAATLPEGEARRRVEAALGRAESAARTARERLVPSDTAPTAAALAEILGELRQAHEQLVETSAWGAAAAEAAAVARIVDEKMEIAQEALAAAAGVAFDAVADREELVGGHELDVDAYAWNAGGLPVTLRDIRLISPGGWGFRERPDEPEGRAGYFGTVPDRSHPGEMAAGDLYRGRFAVAVPKETAPSIPYFLARPLQGSLYDWSGLAPELRGEPFAPPLLTARFLLTVGDVPVAVEREVVYRYANQAVGEVRRPLRVVPAVEVAVEPELLVWPTGRREPRSLEVAITSHLPETTQGRLEVAVPNGWPAVPAMPFTLVEAGSPEVVTVELKPPERFGRGRYPVALTVVLDDGRRFDLAVPLIQYDHIRPTPWPHSATVEVSADEIRVPPLTRVGYIRGASDRVPELLAEIGVPLQILGADELLEGSLDPFDAVVVGSRAYETDPALAQASSKLLDYARRGGLVIVQYQQYPFVRGGFAPYPLEISRPHDRVTDETAPVRLLVPDHPVFHTPNEIGARDWEGWVQERGLYFAGTWDEAYTPLLAMADPGEPELSGGLLIAPLGEGTYVYTGLAFFRQLPAGVPGAYRLFANLLALRGGEGAGGSR